VIRIGIPKPEVPKPKTEPEIPKMVEGKTGENAAPDAPADSSAAGGPGETAPKLKKRRSKLGKVYVYWLKKRRSKLGGVYVYFTK
jgi:hypothetical protein